MFPLREGFQNKISGYEMESSKIRLDQYIFTSQV